MFRKPKRSAKKAGLRVCQKKSKPDDDDDDDNDHETSKEVQEALKRAKREHNNSSSKSNNNSNNNNNSQNDLMHRYEHSESGGVSQKDLATSTQQHHPTSMTASKEEDRTDTTNSSSNPTTTQKQSQSQPQRNKFLAAPIRAPTNIRTTCRFDYQPDICKDYKQTGFCGFGDSCIYLHDRGNTLSGWQLEKVWEQKQKTKREQQEQQITQFMNRQSGGSDGGNNTNDAAVVAADDDGLPFACYLSRAVFDEPIVTPCGHYFNQGCLQDYFTTNNHQQCPICSSETHGVMNQPTKLITKKRKLLGRNATWQEFMDALSSSSSSI